MDRWIWDKEVNGKFTVKSAYKMIQEIETSGDGETSLQMGDRSLWRKIWHMEVSRKIKAFAWKACNDILPTLINLRRKKVEVDSKCCFYQIHEEDITHALLNCPTIYIVWQRFFLVDKFLHTSFSFIQTMHKVLMQGSEAKLTLFCVLCWSVWYRRNQMQMEKNLLQPVQATKRALSMCKVFNDVKAGVGMVMRDTHGAIVMVASKIEQEVDEAATIEAIDVLRGIQLCLPLGIPKVAIETDCLSVVQELQSNETFYANAVQMGLGNPSDVLDGKESNLDKERRLSHPENERSVEKERSNELVIMQVVVIEIS
ncbi:uncharacterized protein LOC121255176 [Juglans microcarpa x Juglans regia]|uniref:uncharacterized protein LOC121255176 n=1 Tax=Juglans microcarpa x Juglans regia TaxID=2249226 RepID=UPI001B7E4147|nr:uncharacterized protein LOC121255176 [Juglans microcarpa x Juglans regia]